MSIRNKPPRIAEIRPFEIPQAARELLPNGIELHILEGAAQEDVLRLEVILAAGRIHERKALVARLTAKMLKLGTRQHNADALSELLDFYGTKLKVSDGFDSTTLHFYCLHRHLEPMLDILIEVLTEPTFDATELDKLVKRSKELLRVDLQKPDFVAYRKFTEMIFGAGHPYGYNSELPLYDDISREDLAGFYEQLYLQEPPTAIISGNLSPEILALVREKLGALPTAGRGRVNPLVEWPAMPPTARQVARLELDGNQQAAIRIGRPLFNKQHKDYPDFFILNTLLGGYFGARLMQNLREDKGYTYGVYSSIDDMRFGGYFSIDTEVGKDVAEDALKQIYSEIELLQTELVDDEELEMVKNYLMGSYLGALDGFFNRSSTFSDAIHAGISMDFLATLADATRNITAERLRGLARQYLQVSTLTEVVVQ